MPDSKNYLYLYEAIELRAEYKARSETLKRLLPESRRTDRLFGRSHDESRSRPAADLDVEGVREEVKALEFKARKLNNAIQRANFENDVNIQGEPMNLAEALELRKAVDKRISELATQLGSAAYIEVIYKEDRDIVEEPDVNYTEVGKALEENRILFRALNRALRSASFQVAVEFQDEE